MAAILKFQDGGPIVVRKNANIGFRKNNALKFLKMYSFANPQNIPTKLLIATTLTELIIIIIINDEQKVPSDRFILVKWVIPCLLF